MDYVYRFPVVRGIQAGSELLYCDGSTEDAFKIVFNR